MPLNVIRKLIQPDLDATDQLICQRLQSSIPLIQELTKYILRSGGKRIRPLLILLSAKAFNYHGEDHLKLATIIELIHTATLLHDDVVDTSELRRGRQTANTVWGNPASILVGDFLYSRAFQLAVELNNMTMLEALAKATNAIAEGEVLQLLNCHNPDTTEAEYLNVLRCKTATLFEVSAHLAAMVCQRNPKETHAISQYAMHLGMAFQLVDDALDYSQANEQLGKNIGDDLAEGKPTLPLIHALQNSSGKQLKTIQQAIKNADISNLEAIQTAIETTQAITYTYHVARKHITEAIKFLGDIPASPYRDALWTLADFTITRNY
jgi:octaprenyl-diphosphate synthase